VVMRDFLGPDGESLCETELISLACEVERRLQSEDYGGWTQGVRGQQGFDDILTGKAAGGFLEVTGLSCPRVAGQLCGVLKRILSDLGLEDLLPHTRVVPGEWCSRVFMTREPTDGNPRDRELQCA